MTKNQLRDIVKDFKEQRKIDLFSREDIERITEENSDLFEFICRDITNENSGYMQAEYGANVETRNDGEKYVDVVFNWEAVPDKQFRFKSEEVVKRLLFLHKEVQKYKDAEFKSLFLDND